MHPKNTNASNSYGRFSLRPLRSIRTHQATSSDQNCDPNSAASLETGTRFAAKAALAMLWTAVNIISRSSGTPLRPGFFCERTLSLKLSCSSPTARDSTRLPANAGPWQGLNVAPGFSPAAVSGGSELLPFRHPDLRARSFRAPSRDLISLRVLSVVITNIVVTHHSLWENAHPIPRRDHPPRKGHKPCQTAS